MRGRMARFFAARRAAGDPYEETVVLPAMIGTAALQLYDLHLIPDWLLLTIFLATNVGAGMWLGACLGSSGTARVVLRSISVSAIEAALLTALNDKLDRHQALFLARQLIGIDIAFFGLGIYTFRHYESSFWCRKTNGGRQHRGEGGATVYIEFPSELKSWRARLTAL